MKNKHKISLSMVMSFFVFSAMGQVENVGIGTRNPDKSAILDLKSTDKGLLIPRLTSVQKLGIKEPVEGLIIYQTDETPGIFIFSQNKWSPLKTNEQLSVATLDANGWSLDGNGVATSVKAAATSASFIGTPAGVSLNFKIGNTQAGKIDAVTDNLFFGYQAGGLTIGSGNVGVGTFSLNANVAGGRNMAFGYKSLFKNVDGVDNVSIGKDAMTENISGGFNTAIGSGALYSNLASANVGIGAGALYSNSTGAGNVGIGVNSANTILGSNNTAIGNNAGRNKNGSGNIYIGNDAGRSASATPESNKLYIANSITDMPLVYGDFAAKYVTIGDVSPALRTQALSLSGGYNLLVKGGILTEKVKVALAAPGTDWADYVFEPEYKSKMLTLEEVEKFTLEYKHLPNVPSAKDMISEGLDVAKTSKMFMEKIEELTLYMIEMNKEIKSLKEENAKLKK